MKIFMLLLFCTLLKLAIQEVIGDAEEGFMDRQSSCLQKFDNHTFSFAYFSEHYMGNKTLEHGDFEDFKNKVTFEPNEDKFLLTCLCQKTFNQRFFVSPYLYEENTFHDAIVFCMNNSDGYQDSGIYDEYEIFDSMLFERIVSVPNSIIDPFVNDRENNETVCYDLFGFPTKNILGQRTCLLAVELSFFSNYKYSGPLLGNAIITFYRRTKLMDEYIFTTTNNSVSVDQEDLCFYELSDYGIKFECFCAQKPELCSPKFLIIEKNKKQKLFCVPGEFGDLTIFGNQEKFWGNISMKEYTQKYINNACSITVTTKVREGNSYSFKVSYGAENNCTDQISFGNEFYPANEKYFCPYALDAPKSVIMKKCCKNGHFCNQELMPEYVQYEKNHTCYYRIPNIVFLTGQSRCDFFVDLQLEKRVKMFLNYNANEPKQKMHKKTINTMNGIEYHYVYLEITKIDPSNCKEKVYNSEDLKTYRPFIHAYCDTFKCDYQPTYTLPEHSTFETVNRLNINNAANFSMPYSQAAGWICYVEIIESNGNAIISAGVLTNIRDHDGCLKKDIMNSDGRFCCSHIFDIQQNDTICTVEKLIKKYKESNPDKINNGTYVNENEYFTDCFIRDLPHDRCLAEAGCFETRMLEYSKNSDAIEPAGCVDSTEKYITQNLPLASVSLGCRVDENSNRCSVIQTPNGQQRILCCCNGKECENDFKNLPNQLGKKISSFKSLN